MLIGQAFNQLQTQLGLEAFVWLAKTEHHEFVAYCITHGVKMYAKFRERYGKFLMFNVYVSIGEYDYGVPVSIMDRPYESINDDLIDAHAHDIVQTTMNWSYESWKLSKFSKPINQELKKGEPK